VIPENRLAAIIKESQTLGRADQLAHGASTKGLPHLKNMTDQLTVATVHSWIYSCIYAITGSAARAPLKIKRLVGDDDFEDVTSREELQCFQKPNRWMSRYDLWEATFWFLESTGMSYWEMVPGRKPEELYPLRPDRVQIIPDARDFIKGFVYKISHDKQVIFDASEVFMLKYFNPLSDYYGMTPIQAAETGIITDLMAIAYNKAFFDNAADPGGILTTPDELRKPTINRLHREWENLHKGVDKSHRLAIVDQGLDYKQVGLNQKDMEFVQSRKMNREEILAAFGVPPVMVGILEHASYANAQEQKRVFWENTMGPKLSKLGEAITALLLPSFGDDLAAHFDLSEIPALQEDRKEQITRAKEAFHSGLMTRNEGRVEIGMEGIGDEGDVFYIPANLIPELAAGGESLIANEDLDEKMDILEERQIKRWEKTNYRMLRGKNCY